MPRFLANMLLAIIGILVLAGTIQTFSPQKSGLTKPIREHYVKAIPKY